MQGIYSKQFSIPKLELFKGRGEPNGPKWEGEDGEGELSAEKKEETENTPEGKRDHTLESEEEGWYEIDG